MTTLGSVGQWEQIGAAGFVPPAANGFVVVVLQSRLNGGNPGSGDYSFDHVYFNAPTLIFKSDFDTP